MDLESSLTSRPVEHDHYQNIREEIEEKFAYFERTLRESKERLLEKLDRIVAKIRDKTQTYRQQFALLHEYKNHTEELLRNNKFNLFKTQQIGGIDEQMGDIKQRYENKIANIQLKWDENPLKEAIEKFCKITIARNQPQSQDEGFRDYSQNLLPVKSFGSKGVLAGDLRDPAGVAIDHITNNIYVADNTKNCIKVFSKEGEFLFQIQDRMYGLYGLCIEADTLYISQVKTSSICMYKLDGTFIKQVGRIGSKGGEFILPLGLCVDGVNGDLYVCDSGNNRIQVFTKNLIFKEAFGTGSLKRPRDVKINHNNEIIVLDSNVFCLHTFDSEGNHLHQAIRNSNNALELPGVREPLFFDIDPQGNAVISDVANHSISVFKMNGVQIKVIGGYGRNVGECINPQGIAVGKDGLIVSACNRGGNMIQIF